MFFHVTESFQDGRIPLAALYGSTVICYKECLALSSFCHMSHMKVLRYHAGTAGSQDHHPPPAAATASNESRPDDSFLAAHAESSTARAAHATAGFRYKVSGFFKRSFSQTPQTVQTVLFCMHLTLVLLAVLHLQPLNRKLSQIAWVYFLQTSLLTHGYKVGFTHVASHPAGHLSTAKCFMPLLCEPFAAKRLLD